MPLQETHRHSARHAEGDRPRPAPVSPPPRARSLCFVSSIRHIDLIFIFITHSLVLLLRGGLPAAAVARALDCPGRGSRLPFRASRAELPPAARYAVTT